MSKDITKDWEDVMNGIWSVIKKKDPNNVRHEKDGEIKWVTYINTTWRLYCNLVNNDYVEFCAERNGDIYLTVRYQGSVNKIIDCLYAVVR